MWLRLNDSVDRWSNRLTGRFPHIGATRIFFKALVVFTIIKMLLIWPVTRTMLQHHSPSLLRSAVGKVVLAPAYFASNHPDIFFAAAICLLLSFLFIRAHYVINVLFFWITFNLYAIDLPISNGSDIVLFMLSFWCIPMVSSPGISPDSNVVIIRQTCFNLAVLCCQVQIACLYFVSGWDKVFNELWRTGEALIYLQHLELLYNPVLPEFLTNTYSNAFFAWSTILIELLFPVLVWKEKTRLIMLAVGTVFHMFIWIVLSLPDFAGIMIISYLIFLKDKDLERIRILFSPPSS